MKGCVIVGVPITMGMLVAIAICVYAVARTYFPIIQAYLI